MCIRDRPEVAREVDLALREVPPAIHPVHDLHVLRVAGHRSQQPVPPVLRLEPVAVLQESLQGERGVPQPAEPVVPVAGTSPLLGQRWGGGPRRSSRAPTTSLPEEVGGARNWDYRFCWLRDAALTLEALLEHGYRFEAQDWRDWLLRAVAGDPQDVQIMYRVDGGRDLPEREIDLPGYLGSRPVRVGNAAAGQVQHDAVGEVLCALAMARDSGLAETKESWALQRMLVNDLARHWREPDSGIWEMRGQPRRFTHSAVMAWAALDRAVHGVEDHGLDGPVERWRAVREEIRADVLANGYDSSRGTFVQYYGGVTTDAALLQIVQVGFLDPQDERFLGTLAAIRADLEVEEGLVHRYLTEQTDDGLLGQVAVDQA